MSSPGGFEAGRVSIKVLPDTSDFRRDLKKFLERLEQQMKVNIPVDLDAKKAITQAAILKKLLDRLERDINIKANLNKDFDNLGDALKNINKNASQAGDGFSRMSHFMLIAYGVLVLIAPLLSLIATLLAGLPSLLLAGGAAFAVFALGAEGFGKAFEAFEPTIERLKKSLSRNFQNNLTPVFKELNKLAPVLDVGLNKVADGLNKIIASMVKFITSAEGMSILENLLGNIGEFFAALAPAITEGLRAFLTLANVASELFGPLAETLRRFSFEFSAMVQRLAETGDLRSAILGLNRVFDALLRLFNALFEAGVQMMSGLADPLVTFIDGFGDALVALMPALTAISTLLFEVLGEALKAIAPVIRELTPGFLTLARTIGTLLVGAIKALGPLLEVVGRILSDVVLGFLQAVQPFIPPFLDFLTQFGKILATTLLKAFVILQPLLTKFFEFIVQLGEALVPLLPKLMELAEAVLQALVDSLIELMPHLLELADKVFPLLIQMVTDLVPILSQIIDVVIAILPHLVDFAGLILDFLVPAMKALIDLVSDIWPSIRDIIQGAVNQIQGIIEFFLGVVTGDWERAWNGIKQFFEGVWQSFIATVEFAARGIFTIVAGIPSSILAGLGDTGQLLVQSGRNLINGFVNGIKSAAQGAYSAVSGVVSSIRSLFPFSPAKTGPFSGSGYTLYSGRALMEDWARGIQQGSDAAMMAVNDVMASTSGAMELNASIAADGYGSIGDKVASALAQWGIQIDRNGLAKMVNNVNLSNQRR